MYFASYKFLSLIYLIILYHPCSLFIVIFILIVQSLGPVQLFKTPWTAASQASLSFTISQRLLKLMSIESVMTCKHLALCRSLLLLPSISGSFPMSQFFTSSGQSIGTSASVLSMNIQDWFPLGLTDLIPLQSKGLPKVFSNTTVQEQQFLSASFLYGPTLTSTHDHWKNNSLD